MTQFRVNRGRIPSGSDVPDSDEVDEVTEISDDHQIGSNDDLNGILHELFETSTVELAGNGLPTLEFLKKNFKTKSGTIRYLYSQGHEVKVIAKHLNTRYQHVRNVLTVELKRGPNEPFKLGEENQIAQVLLTKSKSAT